MLGVKRPLTASIHAISRTVALTAAAAAVRAFYRSRYLLTTPRAGNVCVRIM